MNSQGNEQEKRTTFPNYDNIAYEIFLPIFPVIAREALRVYGRSDGRCLDVGCGGGLFGYFVALLSEMSVHFLDVQEEAIEICRKRGEDWGMTERCDYTVSDVHQMDALPAASFDLIVSRGSIPFWGDDEGLIQAFREINRVLAPGGTAMIGGSLGTPAMSEAITRRMRERNPDWQPPEKRGGSCMSGYERRSELLRSAGIENEVKVDSSGHWIVLRK